MAAPPASDATRIFGERVREFRDELGVSQEQLAKLAGVHWTFVSQVERGLRNVNLHNLLKFAQGLQVDPGDLVAGLEPPPAPPKPEKKPPARRAPAQRGTRARGTTGRRSG